MNESGGETTHQMPNKEQLILLVMMGIEGQLKIEPLLLLHLKFSAIAHEKCRAAPLGRTALPRAPTQLSKRRQNSIESGPKPLNQFTSFLFL